MPTGVRIAWNGAGSPAFSAEIVRDLCVNEGLHGSHLALMDLDEERLRTVLHMSRASQGRSCMSAARAQHHTMPRRDF